MATKLLFRIAVVPFRCLYLGLMLLGIGCGAPPGTSGIARAAPAESSSLPPVASQVNDLLCQSRQIEGSDTAVALQKSQQALALARRDSAPTLELAALLQTGKVWRLLNNYPETLRTIDQGMELAGKLDDQHQMGEFFLLRGLVEWNLAKVPEATVSMMEASRRGDLLGDKALQLGALYGRGLVRGRLDDLDGALENLQAALPLAEGLGDPRRGQVLNSIGVLYLQRKDYVRARETFEQALTALGSTSNLRTTAYVLLNLGQVATETGDQETAGKYLEQSLTLCNRFNFERGIADIAYLQAARQRRLGHLDEALKNLDQAQALAAKLDNPDLYVSVYQEYIETEQARGNYQAALDYTRKLAEKLETVRGEKGRRQAAETRARYEAEGHAHEIKLLEKNRDLQQAKIALKDAELGRAHLFYSAVAVVLLLVGFSLAALASGQRAHARLAERMLLETRAAKVVVEEEDARKTRLLTIASQELLESETRFRSAFEYSALGLALVALDGRWLRVNQALCKIVGYDEEELLARDFQSITHSEDLAADLHLVRGMIAGEIETYSLEKRYVHKRGHLVWVRLDVTMVPESSGPHPAYFISQIHDVTDRRRAQDQLRAAKEEAERANEAKSAFLSRMSHELRTPLNAILGFSQLLGAMDLGSRENQSVEHIVSAGRHLLDLINEVLDIAQIESGQFHSDLEPASVADALLGASSLLEPTAREARVALHLPAAREEPLVIRADPLRLRQVLARLLSNAIKYNRPGGEVFLRYHSDGGRVRIEVSDTGQGIAGEDLEKVFAPFIRLAAAEGVQGSGLGLSVARALTEAMGGTLSVVSEPGKGSTFTLEFACLSPEDAVETPLFALDGLLDDLDEEPGAAATVLYIEDNVDNLELVRYIFSGLRGYALHSAMTGKAGLESARAHPPDLILLDLDLPDMTGVEVLSRLHREPAVANVPVVVVSADATARQIETLRTLGVRDYLTKPIDLGRFRQVVEAAVCADRAAC